MPSNGSLSSQNAISLLYVAPGNSWICLLFISKNTVWTCKNLIFRVKFEPKVLCLETNVHLHVLMFVGCYFVKECAYTICTW